MSHKVPGITLVRAVSTAGLAMTEYDHSHGVSFDYADVARLHGTWANQRNRDAQKNFGALVSIAYLRSRSAKGSRGSARGGASARCFPTSNSSRN